MNLTDTLKDAKEVVVAPEEDVEAHLDVVAVLVDPAAALSAHKVPRLSARTSQDQGEEKS